MADVVLNAVAAPQALDEEAATLAVQRLADDVGAADLFVFRRVNEDRFVHVGGVGRGKGWAGNIEVVASECPLAQEALASRRPVRVAGEVPRHVVGPYYAGAAALVAHSHDVLVLFGTSDRSSADGPMVRDGDGDDDLVAAAAAAAELLDHVSPAKRLADELEILHAIKAMMSVEAEGLPEAMRHVVACAASSLSCELGLLYDLEGGRLAVAELGWQLGVDQGDVVGALRELHERAQHAVCVQDATQEPLPSALGGEAVKAYYALPVGAPPQALLVLMHTVVRPRGFTSLCQELGLRLAETADSVLRTAVLREQLQREIDRVSHDARHDRLTGLGNRLAWEEALADAGRAAGAAVIVCDLNGLKLANDTRGHDVGDQLLVAFADVLRASVRDGDFIARIGGDEVAVLLPSTDYPTCAGVVARIEAAVAAHREIDGFALSAAVGFAASPPAATLEEAQQLADALMYQRKKAARD